MLVNNAAVALDGFNAEVARKTIDANVYGPLNVTDALLPLIPDGGTIVMVSSGVGELSALPPRLRVEFASPNLTRAGLAHAGRGLRRGGGDAAATARPAGRARPIASRRWRSTR